jgi:hypothetical protein
LFLVVGVDIVRSRAFYAGVVEQASFPFVVDERAAELSFPEGMAFFNFIGFARSEMRKLPRDLPILVLGTRWPPCPQGGLTLYIASWMEWWAS